MQHRYMMHNIIIVLLLSSSQFWIQNVRGDPIETNIIFESHGVQEGDNCLLDDGKTGRCANINNCTTLLKEHKLNQPICSWNETTPIICCSVTLTEFDRGCGRRPIDSNLRLRKRQANGAIFNPKYLKPTLYVVGGKPAEPYSWPWMVSLASLKSAKSFCGGCIISEDYVLTAAHCLQSPHDTSDYIVLIGGYKTDEGTSYGVTQIIIHPKFSDTLHYHDIALIKLDKQIAFNQIVNAACLPSPNDDYTDKQPTLLGWGFTHDEKRAEVLQEVTVDIIPIDECNASYSGIRDFREEIPEGITADLLCAGDKAGGKDACQYDSGGPLMLQHYPSQSWEVIGVVAFGHECGHPEYPGVYTKVASYLKWIEENINIIDTK